MALKLFYSPGACSLAVHIALEWIAKPCEAIRIKCGSPEFLRLKKRYDPEECFQSDWYRHYRAMFKDQL